MRISPLLLGLLFVSRALGQICPSQLDGVPLSNWTSALQSSYLENEVFLDALNEPQYDGIWAIGTGIGNSNLSVSENEAISSFIGVKRRSVAFPNDEVMATGNVYTIEPGFSPTSIGSNQESTLAKWNFLMYVNLGDFTFDDVDIRLFIDMDPCFTALTEDMVEIDVASQFSSFFGNASFSAFGINQNLASNFIQAFDSENVMSFAPNAEGYYTLAIGIYDVCGNLKNWNEVVVNVTSSVDSDDNANGITNEQEVLGCGNPLACNFDCSVTLNNGTCDFNSCSGCSIVEACNFNPEVTIPNNSTCLYPQDLYESDHFDCNGNCLNDSDADGICDEDEIAGCLDSTACNYNESATDDSGNCTFPLTGYDCDGVCLIDTDADGVCDEFEIDGCTNPSACNYDSAATEEDGSCEFSTCSGCTVVSACNYNALATISNLALCIYPEGCETCSGETDGTGTLVDNDSDNDGVCDDDEIVGCTVSAACNFDPSATDNANCDFLSCTGCTIEIACNYDDSAILSSNLDCIFPDDCESCSGETDGTGTILSNDVDNDGICDAFEIQGCTDPNACDYDAAATESTVCDYTSCVGCLNPTACNFDNAATQAGACSFPEPYSDCDGCINDVNENGVCDELEQEGCTDPAANNYDPAADNDDGSCVTAIIGCVLPWAPLYDSQATIQGLPVLSFCYPPASDTQGPPMAAIGCTDFAACNYAPGGDPTLPCDYSCLGCTNPTACDYSASAVYNTGCSDFTSCYGCTNSSACNWDPGNTIDDGSCEFLTCSGCTNPNACNFDSSATIDLPATCQVPSGCDTCSGETDGTGTIVDNDSDDDGVCDADEILGCTNSNACNYNSSATESNGSCEFISCTGCMNSSACNYDAAATIGIPASCVYASGCDSCSGSTDGTGTVIDGDTDNDGTCDVDEIDGCMNVNACNYNENANNSDGSCEYTSCVGCLEPSACNYAGSDPSITLNEPIQCVYPATGYDCNGDCSADADNDGICDDFEVPGCTNLAACNFDINATDENGTCTFPAQYEDCNGNCLNDEDGDNVCDELEIFGCTVVLSCNYDPAATENDGSCDFTSCADCKDVEACNYNSSAVLSDNTMCVYDTNPELDFIAVIDTDEAIASWATTDFLTGFTGATSVEIVDYPGRLSDGRFSTTRIYTATTICGTTESAGQLLIASTSQPSGCTNVSATNYDSTAVNDDGSCSFDPACLGDLNEDSIVGATDLLILLSGFGMPCQQ
jgi:hypothetical protein